MITQMLCACMYTNIKTVSLRRLFRLLGCPMAPGSWWMRYAPSRMEAEVCWKMKSSFHTSNEREKRWSTSRARYRRPKTSSRRSRRPGMVSNALLLYLLSKNLAYCGGPDDLTTGAECCWLYTQTVWCFALFLVNEFLWSVYNLSLCFPFLPTSQKMWTNTWSWLPMLTASRWPGSKQCLKRRTRSLPLSYYSYRRSLRTTRSVFERLRRTVWMQRTGNPRKCCGTWARDSSKCVALHGEKGMSREAGEDTAWHERWGKNLGHARADRGRCNLAWGIERSRGMPWDAGEDVIWHERWGEVGACQGIQGEPPPGRRGSKQRAGYEKEK